MGSKTPPKKAVIAGGAVALVVGIVLLLWGLAPAKGFAPAMEVFGGGTPPEDLGDQISATMDELGSRVWADGLGFFLILGGIIAISSGKPQEKSVEQQVQEAFEQRVAGQSTADAPPASTPPQQPAAAKWAPPPATAPPTPAPTPSTAEQAAPPAASTPAKGRCPTCGSVMVAGGRLCMKCG